MATDRTTSAREFLFADSSREPSLPRLSDWLVADLKGARRSSAPPPPESFQSGVETTPPEPVEAESSKADVSATATEPAAHEDEDAPRDDVTEEIEESRDLAASLSYAHENEAPEAAPAPEQAEPLSEEARVYASAEDWLDDDRDSETTAAFYAPVAAALERADDVLEPNLVTEAGASLSPQVLTPEEEDPGAVAIAGVGSGRSWQVVAAIAAASLLLFVVLHRSKHAPRATATAAHPVLAPETSPLTKSEAVAESPPEATDTPFESKGSHAYAYGGTRSHSSSEADPAQDPAIPGGPSVARFPDLPREILNQLEQAFEAGEQQHAKASTDSVERY
ncbi:MAG TPA: hypothetical protein VHC69_00845 [Polyangiaceae bacterium]|nr:hypothetical protein [Polyangiaceae bacterium]